LTVEFKVVFFPLIKGTPLVFIILPDIPAACTDIKKNTDNIKITDNIFFIILYNFLKTGQFLNKYFHLKYQVENIKIKK